MKFWLRILCSCGRVTEYALKRTTNSLVDGKVYEDYTSIEDTINSAGGSFDARPHPEGNIIQCKHCGHRHDLTT